MFLLSAPQIKGLLSAPRTMHVVSIGGGGSSTFKLVQWVLDHYEKRDCVFLYCYLPNEHPDMLDLIFEVERHFGISITFIGYRRTAMEQFFVSRFLGNRRRDPCSANLKRGYLLDYLQTHYPPERTVLHVGVTAHEIDRMIAIYANWRKNGYTVNAPLADDPTITRESIIQELQDTFGWVPELYRLGFEHHNCHGACVKAGKYQWAMLLWHFPKVYAEWEAGEKLFRDNIGPYTILAETVNGVNTPLTLEAFRERKQAEWANLLPGMNPYEGLEHTPPCVFCSAI